MMRSVFVVLSSLAALVAGSGDEFLKNGNLRATAISNTVDRHLQYQPGNGNYPNVDFYFSFDGTPTAPSLIQVEALVCQINNMITNELTPTLQNNQCLVVRAEEITYTFSETGTVTPDFPNYPLAVSFFVDGFTTDNGETRFEHEREVITFFQQSFNARSFIDNHVVPLGGQWGQVAEMAFDGRSRPKEPGTIASVDCPNNPPPPDCGNPPPPPLGGNNDAATSDADRQSNNAPPPEDEGLPWWIITIIVLSCVLVALYCCICCMAMWLCMRKDNKKVVERETYKEVTKENIEEDDSDDDSDDSDDDSDDERPASNKPKIKRKKGGKAAKVGQKEYVQQDEFANADPDKWDCKDLTFDGAASYEKLGEQEEIEGESIEDGIEEFKAQPEKYLAMFYQTDMKTWPVKDQKYTYIHREGSKGYKPNLNPDGFLTLHLQDYQQLPPHKDDELPKKFKDKYTDNFQYGGAKLHNSDNKPLMPGRGMGICDAPNLKIIGDVDPSDIHQGSVGDCWLLSAISSLAEFDGAVKRLFRKTKNLDKLPSDKKGAGNKYTITLWDLKKWKEVDVVVDERLCVRADGSGQLLGAKPSEDGELWVCYLEKALAAHCGGWDKIDGGQCTHGWSLLTGCKEQYTIRQNEDTGKYGCFGKYNPNEEKWEEHANSPHDGFMGVWPMAWPKVGGGGSRSKELDEEELFMKMCAWDDENYIIGAGTKAGSDTEQTDGIVDGHAYSVIECINDVAGTDIDLIKVRNPWGKGEIEDGMFDDDGPGWEQYPEIKKELNPVVADDGIFWVTKEEFFKYFKTIYLSASNMTDFLED